MKSNLKKFDSQVKTDDILPRKEKLIKTENGGLKVISLQELNKMIDTLQMYMEELKKYNPYNKTQTILNDRRTSRVQNGDYGCYYKGNNYIMDTFIGLVVGFQYYDAWPNRKIVKIRIRDGKILGFFADRYDSIKIGTTIEVIGICIKVKRQKDGKDFINLEAKGGYRRILSPEELEQLKEGVSFEDLKINYVPETFLSELKLSKPLEYSLNLDDFI